MNENSEVQSNASSKSQNESLQQLLEFTDKLSHFDQLNNINTNQLVKSSKESYSIVEDIKRILCEKSLEILHINHIMKNIPKLSASFHMKTILNVIRMVNFQHDNIVIQKFKDSDQNDENKQQKLAYCEDTEPQPTEKETWIRKNLNVTFYKQNEVKELSEIGEDEKKSIINPRDQSHQRSKNQTSQKDRKGDESEYGPFDMGERKEDRGDEYESKLRQMKEREDKNKKRQREKEQQNKLDQDRDNQKKEKMRKENNRPGQKMKVNYNHEGKVLPVVNVATDKLPPSCFQVAFAVKAEKNRSAQQQNINNSARGNTHDQAKLQSMATNTNINNNSQQRKEKIELTTVIQMQSMYENIHPQMGCTLREGSKFKEGPSLQKNIRELQTVLDQTLVDASQQINENYKQKIQMRKMQSSNNNIISDVSQLGTANNTQMLNREVVPLNDVSAEVAGNETLIGFRDIRISKSDYGQLIRTGNLSRQQIVNQNEKKEIEKVEILHEILTNQSGMNHYEDKKNKVVNRDIQKTYYNKGKKQQKQNNIKINSTKNMNLFIEQEEEPNQILKLPKIEDRKEGQGRSHTDNFNLDMLKQKDWGQSTPGKSSYIPKSVPLAQLQKLNEKSLMRNTQIVWKLPRERNFYKTTSSYQLIKNHPEVV